jgi:diguanylate cyclase (GGDEF)-like protein
MLKESVLSASININSLLAAMATNEDAILARLDFLNFNDQDAAVLASLHQALEGAQQQFVDAFHSHLNSFAALQPSIHEPSLVRLKHMQGAYFSSLSKGPYDKEYVRNRIAVGIAHQFAGLTAECYLGACSRSLDLLMPVLWKISGNNFPQFQAALAALTKIIFFDIGIVLDSYFAADKMIVMQSKEKLAFQMAHDELTGLPSHSLLMSRLQQDILLAQHRNRMVALLIVDIDRFKLINDSIGHTAGDQLIKDFASRLCSCRQADDTVSRHSGDAFALILKDISEPGQVSAICENISRIVAAPFAINGEDIHLTCSIGVALYPQDGADPALLSKFANLARYRAKELGRNNFQFYFHEMNERMLERATLENALRSAVATDQLELHYQPMVDLQSGQIIGLEALLCWQHPELGMVAPARFIPVAEECGLINSLGEWVLQRACHDMRTWIDKGIRVPQVAINVSPRQFRDPHLIHKIESALTGMQIDPGLISLEITEGVLMSDAPSSEVTLRELKRLGVTLSLDDFGTGYSSLSFLKRFPFDRVKIDQSFVRDVMVNQYDAAIANAIISLAHSIGIKVIADGVETEAQCEFMRNSMCDEIQGCFFSKPLLRENLEMLLSEERCLPSHLLRLQKPPRTLLLVDDEPNILASLKRLLRPAGYQILTASSGKEGLDLLEKNKVDIILSDQRMPGMTGVEFLRTAKSICPDTVRIVLSGYTELQSVTDAINEGAVYRFLTKPWDDQQLRGYIEEAFQHKELADENRHLNLKIRTANQELASSNRRLEEMLKEKQQQIARDEVSLEIVREALQHIPFPVIGVDDDGMIAFVNTAASTLFRHCGPILGSDLAYTLPAIDAAISGTDEGEDCIDQIGNQPFRIKWHRMGEYSQSRGKLITLTKYESEP